MIEHDGKQIPTLENICEVLGEKEPTAADIPVLADIVHAKRGWADEVLVKAANKELHEKSNEGAETTMQQVHGLARTIKEFVEDMTKVKK